jgi:hypothetical protein
MKYDIYMLYVALFGWLALKTRYMHDKLYLCSQVMMKF